MPDPSHSEAPALVRGLGAWDGALITIGSIVGLAVLGLWVADPVAVKLTAPLPEVAAVEAGEP